MVSITYDGRFVPVEVNLPINHVISDVNAEKFGHPQHQILDRKSQSNLDYPVP